MRELTRAEAAQLARSGTKFLANGKELTAHEIRQLRPPVRKQNLLHQLFERLVLAITDGFARLSEIKLPPTNVTLNAPEKKPVAWVFAVQTDADGRIKTITATPKL